MARFMALSTFLAPLFTPYPLFVPYPPRPSPRPTLQFHNAAADHPLSRFWLLTTLLGLWKVYTTPPRRLEDVSSTPAQAETRSTAYKLWSDLVFVCESHPPSLSLSRPLKGILVEAAARLTPDQRTTCLA